MATCAGILPAPMAVQRTRAFTMDGHRLVYDEYGGGPRTLVLIPGLLLSRRMHASLADSIADRGYRVICLDLLGHGESDRPDEMWRYSMTGFGENVLALLDHLGVEDAVVGGTSLGANVSLEVAAAAPERLRGLVVEMPVLERALLACAVAFTPLLIALTVGRPGARLVASLARRVPRGAAELSDTFLDWLSQDPAPSAAVLEGLFFGRIAPPRAERKAIEVPTLVLGHPRDPIHPFSDAGMLVEELPNGRLVEATSMLELRLRPERLTGEIARFLDGLWLAGEPRRAARGRRQPGRSRRASA
jgi:pimeloyl-ACP methyl ester carboxylesterase